MRARFVVLAVIVALLSASAGADSQARIVRLSYLEGNVQLDRGDGNGYIRAFLNMPLIEGASVWIAADARAEIEFEDGSTARLAPNTIVVFTELRLRSDGSRLSSLTLSDGVAYFSVKHDRDDMFRVFAGDRELTLEKTSTFRVVHSARQDPFDLRVAVFKGELRFIQPDGQRVAVKKNETLTLDLGEADNRYFLARGIVEEAHDYWDRERDEDRVVLARKQAQSVYYSDLRRYGSFITVSHHGELWRPYGVSYNWNPFASGAWVYYRGYGYIFVSDHLWGWTPYRYGAWVHVPSYGWCWRPAGMYRPGYWNPHPVIVNAPGGYVAPVPPATPSGPVVSVGGGMLDPPIRDGRVRPLDGPEGSDGGVIQDRIRGIRTADTRFPRTGRTADPSTEVRPSGGTGRARDLDQPVGVINDRPPRSGRSSETIKTVGGGPREGDIDVGRDTDTPVQGVPSRVTPAGVSTPATPGGNDRPARPQRIESAPVPVIQDRPSRPTRVETPPPQATPPVQTAPPAPVMSDRPARPARVDSPPPVIQDRGARPSRVETPPPPRPQPQTQPSSPPPQRIAPPPSAPPPSAPAPRVNDAPARTTVKDQAPLEP